MRRRFTEVCIKTGQCNGNDTTSTPVVCKLFIEHMGWINATVCCKREMESMLSILPVDVPGCVFTAFNGLTSACCGEVMRELLKSAWNPDMTTDDIKEKINTTVASVVVHIKKNNTRFPYTASNVSMGIAATAPVHYWSNSASVKTVSQYLSLAPDQRREYDTQCENRNPNCIRIAGRCDMFINKPNEPDASSPLGV